MTPPPLPGSQNLSAAKKGKNDEFYTQLADIEKELAHYNLKGKTIYCNCDTKDSNFVKYFESKDVKLLTSSCDFRSPESIALLEQADIVVTNPPFSLFREYVDQLMQFEKKFLIIGNMNAMSYKEIFPLLRDDKMWLGYNCVRWFGTATNEELVEGARSFWYTNLDIAKRSESITLYKKYSPKEYPKYDNYNAINVNKVADIPMDYKGAMGVPITFMDKYNPKQFEILSANDVRKRKDVPFKAHGLIKDKDGTIEGKPTYVRVVIRNRNPQK